MGQRPTTSFNLGHDQIIGCAVLHGVTSCGQCAAYPCPEIKAAFKETMLFEPNCRLRCNAEEYEAMRRAFFEKEKNLDEVASQIKASK